MIRRAALAAVALAVLGGIAAPAFAADSAATTANRVVCVLATNHSSGSDDGICVWVPSGN